MFYANNLFYAKLLLSLPGLWDSGTCWARGTMRWAPGGLPWLATFHTCCPNPLLRELSSFCATPLGENDGSLHLISPRLFAPRAFSFADFVLYPLGIINQSHEYNSVWKLWVLLGNHQIRAGLGGLPAQGPGCGDTENFYFWMKFETLIITQTRCSEWLNWHYFWLKVGRNAMRPIKFSCSDRAANSM